MNEPWVIIVTLALTLIFGAPVMTAFGTWVQARFGLLKAQIEEETDLAKQARDQEYAERLAWQQRQSREMDNLRSKNATLEDALRDTVRRCDDLERQQRTMAEQLARQTMELEELRRTEALKDGEIVQLRNRVLQLESELYRTQQELSTERAARIRLEGKAG